MAHDMDIDMDLDIGVSADDFAVPEVDDIQIDSNSQSETPILNAPDTQTDPASLELVPNKVHIRGLDNLNTGHVRAFAAEHYTGSKPEHVEWIDDSSANLVYESEGVALEALKAFIEVDVTDVILIPLLQSVAAKRLSTQPQASLEVRRAVVGDRKQPRARERSRFYLFNPEYDPAERRKRGGNGGKIYRDREDRGYQSQRYDDREQRNRVRGDEEAGFDASLYDDDDAALARRAARRREYSISSSDSQERRVRSRGAAGKELFPSDEGRNNGRLRDRSASPLRDDSRDRRDDRDRYIRKPRAAAENRLKAEVIKAKLREAAPTKELFPQKVNASHRRSSAFDAADETADLFASKMAVPLVDGPSDERLNSTSSTWDNITGFSIRGASKAPAVPGFSIKGAAGGQVKELFPAHFGDNTGKELFSGGLEGRGRRRQKAEDLFY
ncbi:hypothetical protein HYALB_00009656 [Hymenoscyphus albidus]|uniref:Uncharacterized protein n=1 Tax=Hymenoscyphus albidus TaxID=595503 RepID=A0A9N9LIS7_9HELO|nr:hypothetical protein HYALB_00009656 [Hymenoscyphus albidus]